MVDLAALKAKVFPRESGGDYNALYGFSNRPGGRYSGVQLTDMTVDQALAFANPRGEYGQWVKSTRPDKQYGIATPMGAWQIVGSTMAAAKKGMGLTGNERLTPEMQDQMAAWIYNAQGPSAWSLPSGVGGGGGGSRVSASSKGGPSMGLLDFQAAQEPQTFKDRLRQSWQDGSLMDSLALAFNSMRMNPDQGLAQIVRGRQEQRTSERNANRTAQWLMSVGRDDLARALMSGAVDAKTAAAVALTPPTPVKDERTALMQNYEYARANGFQGSFTDFMQSGGGGGSVINVGDTVKIMPDGRLAVSDPNAEGGIRFVTPPGSQAAVDTAAVSTTKQNLADRASDSIALIDSIAKDPALPQITGMIQGRMPPMSQAGTNLAIKIEQLQGQTFLQAFESLKGGGAITEREGAAAQNAIARLQRTQDEREYVKALNELRTYLDRGRRRLAGESIPDMGATINGVTVGDPVQ